MLKSSYYRKNKKITKKSKYKQSYIPKSINPMMGDSTAYTRQVWTQTFELKSFTTVSEKTNFAYFVVACLGIGAMPTSTNLFNLNSVQTPSQTG